MVPGGSPMVEERDLQLEAEVATRLSITRASESRRFEVGWTITLVAYICIYSASAFFIPLSFVPPVSLAASLLLHAVAILSHRCSPTRCTRTPSTRTPRSLWCRWTAGRLLSPQLWHTLAVTVDLICIVMGGPEVQYALSSTRVGRVSRALGQNTICTAGILDGKCRMLQQLLQCSMLAHAICFFYVLFVLNFRQAAALVVALWLMLHGTNIAVNGPFRTSRPELGWCDVVYSTAMLSLMLVGKWRIEQAQQLLVAEVAQKSRQVVQEKVKRCQLEFQVEAITTISGGLKWKGCEDAPSSCPDDAAAVDLEARLGAAFASPAVQGDSNRYSRRSGRLTSSGVSSSAASSGNVFVTRGLAEEHFSQGSSEEHLSRMLSLGRREHWLIDPEQLQVQPVDPLGKGSFGVVVRGTFVGSPVAVKVARNHGSAQQGLPQLANELRVLRHVRHPNIALFHGAVLEPASDTLAIVLELVEGLDLEAYIQGGGPGEGLLGEAARCWALTDICCALTYLHTRHPSITHGDVKPTNMIVELLRASLRVKLLDFGLSRVMTPRRQSRGGTPRWMAPELLDGRETQLTIACDVYSFGCVALFVTSGQLPHTVRFDRQAQRIRRTPLPPWPASRLPERCRPLGERCLSESPAERPALAEVMEDLHRWPEDLWLPPRSGSPAADGCGGAGGSPMQMPWSAVLPHLDKITADTELDADAACRRACGAAAAGPIVNLGKEPGLPLEGGPGALEAGGPAAAAATTPACGSQDGRTHAAGPGWARTPRLRRQIMMCETMFRWAGEAQPRAACCTFHARIRDSVDILVDMLAQGCKPHLFAEVQQGYSQCPNCLVLDACLEGGRFVCDVCSRSLGASVSVAAASAIASATGGQRLNGMPLHAAVSL